MVPLLVSCSYNKNTLRIQKLWLSNHATQTCGAPRGCCKKRQWPVTKRLYMNATHKNTFSLSFLISNILLLQDIYEQDVEDPHFERRMRQIKWKRRWLMCRRVGVITTPAAVIWSTGLFITHMLYTYISLPERRLFCTATGTTTSSRHRPSCFWWRQQPLRGSLWSLSVSNLAAKLATKLPRLVYSALSSRDHERKRAHLVCKSLFLRLAASPAACGSLPPADRRFQAAPRC